MEAVTRIGEFAHRLEVERGGTAELSRLADEAEAAFREALDDDLNAPEALGALFSFTQRANAELDRRGSDQGAVERARAVFSLMDGVLDVRPRALRFTVGIDGVSPDPATVAELSAEERAGVVK